MKDKLVKIDNVNEFKILNSERYPIFIFANKKKYS